MLIDYKTIYLALLNNLVLLLFDHSCLRLLLKMAKLISSHILFKTMPYCAIIIQDIDTYNAKTYLYLQLLSPACCLKPEALQWVCTLDFLRIVATKHTNLFNL